MVPAVPKCVDYGTRRQPEIVAARGRLLPTTVSGLLQTEDYARALLSTYPAVSAEAVSARMERQRRLFARDIMAWFIVDELSLYRLMRIFDTLRGECYRVSESAALL